jgi:hypothetical protein
LIVKEESPSKVDRIIEGPSEAENMIDDEFPDDGLLSVMPPWHLYDYPYYPLGGVFDKLKVGDSINVIPSIYGRRGECRDVLLVVIEPQFMTFLGDEVVTEMRIRKRIESARTFLKKCSTVRYMIFLASIFGFRTWSKLKGSYAWPTVILKPWKQKYEFI